MSWFVTYIITYIIVCMFSSIIVGPKYGSSLGLLSVYALDNPVVMVLGFPVGCIICISIKMVMGALVGYPLVGSIGIFLFVFLFNCFDTWEVSLVVVSIGTLGGLMIVTW